MKAGIEYKLPLTANWWRDGNKSRKTGDPSMILELAEYSLEDAEVSENSEKKDELEMKRGTTLDSTGDIDTSNIRQIYTYNTERENYENICEQMSCPTSRKFAKYLEIIASDTNKPGDINMAYYGLDDKGIATTSLSISNLGQCSLIDLQGNILSKKSLSVLVSMLKSSRIAELNLSFTGIGKFGSIILVPWITSTKSLKILSLRGNNFSDDNGSVLFQALSKNNSVVQLDLSENRFCTGCSNALKAMIEDNDSIEILNLNWNHLRLQGSATLSKALKKNCGLKILSIGWNGFEDNGAKELGMSIKDNDYLEELDVSANRITDIGLAYLLKAFEKNKIMKVLRIGQNRISQEAAEKSLDLLKKGNIKGCSLNLLDFTNTIFRPSFQQVIDSVKSEREQFDCVFGYSDTWGKTKQKSTQQLREAMQILKEFLDVNKTDLLKLFQDFMTDQNQIVTYDDFREGVQANGIPLSDNQIRVILNFMDKNYSGAIQFSDLNI